MNLIIFLLSLVGGTYIICDSEIMSKFRKSLNKGEDPRNNIPTTLLAKLISCPRCTSFWLSMPLAIIAYTGAWWLLIPLVGIGIMDIWRSVLEIVEDYIKCQL